MIVPFLFLKLITKCVTVFGDLIHASYNFFPWSIASQFLSWDNFSSMSVREGSGLSLVAFVSIRENNSIHNVS